MDTECDMLNLRAMHSFHNKMDGVREDGEERRREGGEGERERWEGRFRDVESKRHTKLYRRGLQMKYYT